MNSHTLVPPRQWHWWGLVPVIVGLWSLTAAHGWWTALLVGIPALLWLGSGLALLLMPGDARVTAYMALGSACGLLFSIPMALATDLPTALLMAAGALASFLVSGRVSLTQYPTPASVPETPIDARMQFKVGLDESVLGFFLLAARLPAGAQAQRMCDQALELDRLTRERGWLDDPTRLHLAPPVPEQVNAQAARCYGYDYERITFDSGFAADPALPGASEWGAHVPNRRAFAWMLRHPGPTRPWLLCIHGYRMGMPWVDFGLFPPAVLHRKLGLNVLMPILPLHGPRRVGRMSGDRYLDGDLLELTFAQSQALWDLRRWLAWLRSNEDRPEIGVYGVSLGGYNTALLSCYEPQLAFAIAAIPVVDYAATLWQVMPPLHRRYFEARGLTEALYRELLRPVSPLSLPSRVAAERRYVVAASGDRIVPPGQPPMLAAHWKVEPRWYAGSHMSIRNESAPRVALEDAMRRAGWDQDFRP